MYDSRTPHLPLTSVRNSYGQNRRYCKCKRETYVLFLDFWRHSRSGLCLQPLFCLSIAEVVQATPETCALNIKSPTITIPLKLWIRL